MTRLQAMPWMILVAMAHCLSAFNLCKAAADDPATSKRPPNIVFFLVDDMGWTDPHCYGNDFHETPNIDRLAAEGMRFTNAYAACPVCSPTRASIMTGKYPATLNLTDFIPGHWRPWEKLIVPKMNLQLPLEEVTFAEELKRAGYVSGAFGKWHLGGRANFPAAQGFDDPTFSWFNNNAFAIGRHEPPPSLVLIAPYQVSVDCGWRGGYHDTQGASPRP